LRYISLIQHSTFNIQHLDGTSMNHTVSLTENRDFQRLYSRGKSGVSPSLVMYCHRNRLPGNRLGFTTGKKIGGAVRRNRARRRLSEAFRLAEPGTRTGYDIVIVARTRCLTQDFKKLRNEMDRLLRDLGLLRDPPHPAGRLP
jgi:ribonuclease P protein component